MLSNNNRQPREKQEKKTLDPLGQTHSLASSKHCFHLKFVFLLDFKKWGRMYVRTTRRTKAMITTGLDCGSAEWIKRHLYNDDFG